MSTHHPTVHDRLALVRSELTPAEAAAGILLVAALGVTLLFLQEPLAHESLHDFRHAAGITCH
jgi:hypothetical protein